jgi:cystathionine beta-lyase
MLSAILIRDAGERERFRARAKAVGMLNPLSLAAHQAAYERGGEWLRQLKEYLDGNFALLDAFLKEELPETVFTVPEATYLAWVDMSGCLPGVTDLPGFFANEAGVLLEGGNSLFVGNAEGFVRLNLAMPRSILETGMERIAASVEKYRKSRG